MRGKNWMGTALGGRRGVMVDWCRRGAAGGVLLLVSLVLPAGAARASTTYPLPTVSGLFIQRWAPTTMASSQTMTQSQAVTIAETFDVVTAKSGVFTPYLAAMRAANPDVVVLQYENATFATSATQYPSAWYARDASGKRVRSLAPGAFNPGNYLMDMSNADYLAAAAQSCATDRAADGYDGCYYGMLSLAMFSPGYLSAAPIDPVTGQPWTEQNFVVALQNELSDIRAANPGVIITGNTLHAGNYFATNGTSTRPLLDAEDAGQDEDFLHNGTQKASLFPGRANWLKQINMLVDAGSRGDTVLAQTKLWTTATAAQIDQWHKFAVASFLLATDGRSYLNFSTGRTMAALTADSPYDRVNVGTPTAAYAFQNGVYQRPFTAGLALVNPTSAAATVPLSQCYTGLDGTRYTGSITLQPDQGDVLQQNC